MNQRQVYRIKAGKINNLRITSEGLQDPQPHEVQIEVRAIGLNFADIFAIWGLYSATPKEAFIPGLEYAGIVRAIGSNISHIEVGDRMMGITRFGAYATALNIDHRYVVPIPDDWNFQEGAAFLVQVLTAYYGLFKLGDLQPKQNVLVHSGAGGVGVYANRLAKALDAYTIGTTGSPAKIDYMKKEGYDKVIVRSRDFADDLSQALEGRPLHVVMECIGGQIFRAGFDALAPEGRMVIYGSAQYATAGNRPNYLRLLWKYVTRPKIDPLVLPNKNRSILGFNLIWLYEQVEKMHQLLQEIEKYDLGRPLIGHHFGFAELPDAIRLFQTGNTRGKIVIEILS